MSPRFFTTVGHNFYEVVWGYYKPLSSRHAQTNFCYQVSLINIDRYHLHNNENASTVVFNYTIWRKRV